MRVCCYHLLHDGEAILCRDVFNASWDRCFKHQNESSKKGPCFYQEIWHFRIMTPSNKFFFHRFLRNTKKMDLPDSWLQGKNPKFRDSFLNLGGKNWCFRWENWFLSLVKIVEFGENLELGPFGFSENQWKRLALT